MNEEIANLVRQAEYSLTGGSGGTFIRDDNARRYIPGDSKASLALESIAYSLIALVKLLEERRS